MAVFDCVLCHARYEVNDALVGKTIRCRECGEFGRVLAPKARPERSPPDEPQPQAEESVRRKAAWYYRFLPNFAVLVIILGGLMALMGLGTAPIIAARLPEAAGGVLFLFAVAGAAIAVLYSIGFAALVMLFVDIGRSLRRMKPKRRGSKW
jgi:hypothetical protein